MLLLLVVVAEDYNSPQSAAVSVGSFVPVPDLYDDGVGGVHDVDVGDHRHFHRWQYFRSHLVEIFSNVAPS